MTKIVENRNYQYYNIDEMETLKKTHLFAFLSLLGVASLGLGIGATYSGFAGSDVEDQSIGSQGVLKVSIFLTPGEWANDNAVFVMHVWNSSDGDIKANVLSSKRTATDYVFLFDSVTYDRLMFYRTRTGDIGTGAIGGDVWNKSDDYTYDDPTDHNKFVFATWHGGVDDNSSFTSSKYSPS